jgi:hypothetical protein
MTQLQIFRNARSANEDAAIAQRDSRHCVTAIDITRVLPTGQMLPWRNAATRCPASASDALRRNPITGNGVYAEMSEKL